MTFSNDVWSTVYLLMFFAVRDALLLTPLVKKWVFSYLHRLSCVRFYSCYFFLSKIRGWENILNRYMWFKFTERKEKQKGLLKLYRTSLFDEQ